MRVAVKLALAVAVLGSGLASVGSAQRTDPSPDGMRDCAERVEGGVVRPSPPADTVIGPIGWVSLADNWDPDQQRRGRRYGFDVTPMKALAIVRAGPAVGVSVPPAQRAWMWLDYEGAEAAEFEFRPCPRGATEAEQREACGWEPFNACRSGLTQFNGSIGVDYADAPDRGRCARLVVRVEGQRGARRARAFDPPPGLCDATGRTVVLGSPEYAYDGDGWGGARPRRLSRGESGPRVTRIRWTGWGSSRATGRGRAGGIVELAASRIGRCPGYRARMYRALRVRRPGGPWRRWDGPRSLCEAARAPGS